MSEEDEFRFNLDSNDNLFDISSIKNEVSFV